MKRAILLLASAMCILGGTREMNATHVSAAEILYEYTGIPNRWLVTLKAYRDCSPGTATMPTPSTTICYHSASLGISGSFAVTLLPGSGQQIPPTICIPPGAQTQCYQEYVYQGTITLPQQATDWKFMWQLCCMNNAINTIQGPGGITFYTESTLNSVVAPTNNSPTFTFIPIARWCVNNQYYYAQGTVEVDGDDIDYELVPALNTTGTACPYATTPVTYIAPYSATNPISTTSGFGFNTSTGVMNFTPNLIQIGLVCVNVREFRNGIQVGSVRRVMQVNVISGCAIIIPQFTNLQPLPNGMNGIHKYCGDTTLILHLNTNIQCGSIVPTDLRVTESTGFPNPVIGAQPINCVNNFTNSILVTLYNPLKAGLNWIYTKVGNDGNTFLSECGSQMDEFDSIPIWVVDTTTWIPAQITIPNCSFNQFTVTFNQLLQCNTIAPNLSDWVLQDAQGVTVPIVSVTSNCQPGNPLSYQQTFTFTIVPGNYTNPLTLSVQTGTDNNTIANYCGTLLSVGQTMAIINFLTGIPVDLGPDITGCSNTPVTLNAGWSGTYTWTWNGIQLPDTTQQITVNQSGTYAVHVTLGGSCEGSDTIEVTLIDPPVVSLGNDITICSTDPIPLLDCGIPGAYAYQWYLNGNPIPGATGQTYQPTTGGLYSVVVSSAPGCDGSDDIQITIIQRLPDPTVSDAAYCQGSTVPVLDAGLPGYTYQWYDASGNPIPGATGQTFQPSGPGTYTVVVSSGTCTSQGTATITEVFQPTITTMPATLSFCASDAPQTLTAGNQPSGVTILWSDGSTTNTIQVSASGVYTVTVTYSASGISCSATAQTQVTVNANPVIDLGPDVSICAGDNPITLTPSPSITGSYLWSNGATTSSIQTNQAGTYTVTVTDQNGCSGTDAVALIVNPLPTLSFSANVEIHEGHIHLCKLEEFPLLTINVSPNTQTINWFFNNNPLPVTGNTYQTPSGEFGTYMVEITDSNGCRNSAMLVLEEEPCDPIIPNIITPNFDGFNDTWVIQFFDPSFPHKVVIFNRWGQEVFSTTNYQNDWYGKDYPDGTYFYVFEYNGITYKGTITKLTTDQK